MFSEIWRNTKRKGVTGQASAPTAPCGIDSEDSHEVTSYLPCLGARTVA